VTILNILQYPDPRLRLKAKPVTDFGSETQKNVSDMFDTLYGTPHTAGFAAIQLNIQQSIVVIDLSEYENEPLCLINPEIVEKSAETTYEPEGCLSVAGEISEPVTRAASIKLSALNAKGVKFEMNCDGFLAKCIQHEVDHLKGILFIDYLSELKRSRIDKKLFKLRKEAV